jgi:hypothetical protein
MDAHGIRSFVRRRWDLVEQSKLRARAERYRRGGPEACVAAAAELRERWRLRHPEGPSKAARAEDFRHHVELSAKLAKIADALTRR